MTGTLKRIVVLVWAAGLALACQTQDEATEQASETSPAIDEAAVTEAIAAKDRAYGEAVVAGDVEAIMQQYAADAVLLPPGAPMAEGTAAIRPIFDAWVEQGLPTSMTLTTDDVTVTASGDYAYAVGSASLSGTAPDGSEWSEVGKYVAVWKNVDGDWKMVADIWNSDIPLAGMESAGAPSEEMAPAE